MKSVVFALSLFALSAFTPLVAQNPKLDFTLLNRTGLTISELYVSPTNVDDWEEDVLGRDVLKHGESVDIEFSRSEKSCMWDLKIVDAEGDAVEWDNLDLCKAAHITLQYEGGRATAVIK